MLATVYVAQLGLALALAVARSRLFGHVAVMVVQ